MWPIEVFSVYCSVCSASEMEAHVAYRGLYAFSLTCTGLWGEREQWRKKMTAGIRKTWVID